jgi:HAD superfamily hydrolase (TIGR01509 family)
MQQTRSIPPVLVLDMIGVVFLINRKRILRNLGLGRLLLFYLTRRENPIDEGMKILDRMRREMPGQYQEVMGYKGNLLPACFVRWHTGLCAAEQVVAEFTQFCEQLKAEGYFTSTLHYQMITDLVKVLVNEDKGAICPNPALTPLLQKIRSKGAQRLFLLTNIDHETYKALSAHYPEIFNLFEGRVTSCETGLLKPDPAIFNYLCGAYKLSPAECFYIDDQLENVQAANGCGIQGAWCPTNKNLLTTMRDIANI